MGLPSSFRLRPLPVEIATVVVASLQECEILLPFLDGLLPANAITAACVATLSLPLATQARREECPLGPSREPAAVQNHEEALKLVDAATTLRSDY